MTTIVTERGKSQIIIDNKTYELVFKGGYIALIEGLFFHLTNEQKKKVSVIKNDVCFVYPKNVVSQFVYYGEQEETNGMEQCVCGVKISKVHFVINRKSKKAFKIGRICIKKWFPKAYDKYIAKLCEECGKGNVKGWRRNKRPILHKKCWVKRLRQKKY